MFNWILLLLRCKLFRDRDEKGSPGSDYGDTYTPSCFSWGPLCGWYQQHGWFHNLTEIRCGGVDELPGSVPHFLNGGCVAREGQGIAMPQVSRDFLFVMCCSRDQ